MAPTFSTALLEPQLRMLSRFFSFNSVMKQSTMATQKVKLQEVATSPIPDTGLHKFETIPKNPFTLFRSWYSEHQTENHITSNALNLSTATKDGKVTSRSLLLRRLDDDGFVIITDNRSKKSRELAENPSASMVFLWLKEINGLTLSRQVRIEGDIKQLPTNNWIDIYEREPLFCKLRAYVCHQGKPISWESQKAHHDDLLKRYEEGKLDLSKPDHVVAYKLFPSMIEFYESLGPRIADRVMYLRDNNDWNSTRIAA